MNPGMRLRKWRQQNNLSRPKLALLIKCQPKTIKRFEDGQFGIRAVLLGRLAALGVDITHLLTGKTAEEWKVMG